MNGFDTNEPSRMGIICLLSSPLYLVPSTTWGCVWQISEELELVRLSEFGKKREKGKETKGL